jgi:hypothetical protein
MLIHLKMRNCIQFIFLYLLLFYLQDLYLLSNTDEYLMLYFLFAFHSHLLYLILLSYVVHIIMLSNIRLLNIS